MQQKPSATHEAPLSYWQETAPNLTPTSALPSHADVVVIGGGLLGMATGYWVARAGGTVIMLERDAPAFGATGRNGGFVAFGPGEPYAQAITHLGVETARAILEITRDNQALLRQVLAEERIACEYREPGHLHLALDEEHMQVFAQSRLALDQEGVATEVLERDQLAPLLATPPGPQIRGGFFMPGAGLIHPVKLVQGVLTAAQRYGAQYARTTVLDLSADGEGIRVQTTDGTIQAASVIVATNAWIPDLLPELQHVITPVRGQVLATQPVPPVFSTGVTAHLTETEEYWQQAPDGSILLGGCRAVAAGHDVGVQESLPTPDVQHALEQVLPRLFPQLPALHITHRWAGLMAFTRDGLPIADRVSRLPNTWVVGGFSGHGMPYGFRLGQLLAQAALTMQTPAALLPFRRNRATLPS